MNKPVDATLQPSGISSRDTASGIRPVPASHASPASLPPPPAAGHAASQPPAAPRDSQRQPNTSPRSIPPTAPAARTAPVPPPVPSSRPPLPPSAAVRSSFPPPVPPMAAARASVPPPIPSRAMSTPPAPITGATLTGIHSPSRVPPPPPPAPRREEMQQAIATAQTELRQARLEIERQREQIKGRDSHIAQLREKLQARDATVAALEAELTELRNRPEPVTQLTAAAAPAGDDLKRIRGIGAGYERALQQAGVTTFAAIAAWTDDDVTRFAELLHTHRSRIERSQWVQQARELAQPPA